MAMEYYSLDEVLKELQLNDEELEELVANGEIRVVSEGNKLKYCKDDVEEVKRNRMDKPTLLVSLGDSQVMVVGEEDTPSAYSLAETLQQLQMEPDELETFVADGEVRALIEATGTKYRREDVDRLKQNRMDQATILVHAGESELETVEDENEAPSFPLEETRESKATPARSAPSSPPLKKEEPSKKAEAVPAPLLDISAVDITAESETLPVEKEPQRSGIAPKQESARRKKTVGQPGMHSRMARGETEEELVFEDDPISKPDLLGHAQEEDALAGETQESEIVQDDEPFSQDPFEGETVDFSDSDAEQKQFTAYQIAMEEKRRRKQKMTTTMGIGAGILAFLLLSLFVLLQPGIPQYQVSAMALRAEPFNDEISLSGTVLPQTVTPIVIPLAATVGQMLKKKGDYVKSGEVLLALKSDSLLQKKQTVTQAIQSLEQEIAAHQQRLADLPAQGRNTKKAIFEIAAQLKQKEKLSREQFRALSARDAKLRNQYKILSGEFKNTRQALRTKQSALPRLQEELAQVEKELQQMSIRSSSEGQILEWFAQENETLNPGQVLGQIGQIHPLQVIVEFPEKPLWQIDESVSVQLNGSEAAAPAIVAEIRPANSGKWQAVLTIANTDLAIRLPATATLVYLRHRYEHAIFIPQKACWQEGEEDFVFLVQNGRLVKRKIQKSLVQTDRVLAIQGLAGGDQLITSGWEDLKEGMEVIIAPR